MHFFSDRIARHFLQWVRPQRQGVTLLAAKTFEVFVAARHSLVLDLQRGARGAPVRDEGHLRSSMCTSITTSSFPVSDSFLNNCGAAGARLLQLCCEERCPIMVSIAPSRQHFEYFLRYVRSASSVAVFSRNSGGGGTSTFSSSGAWWRAFVASAVNVGHLLEVQSRRSDVMCRSQLPGATRSSRFPQQSTHSSHEHGRTSLSPSFFHRAEMRTASPVSLKGTISKVRNSQQHPSFQVLCPLHH